MNNLVLEEVVNKYYKDLESMVNNLATKCTGGEETKVVFLNGTVTIKLK